jgi:hypothetical protein
LEEHLANAVVFLVIYGFLVGAIFKPSLMLSDTITAGGDMASHYFPAKYLKEELLPKGHIIGWLPGWYGGLPLFQYYFFLPFLLMSVLSVAMPLQVAFKLVTVLGVFLLPVCAFFLMRMLGFRFPMPAFAAIFTMPFLFMENHSMWGGNIPSTLAGEFSYSISLSLTVLFFGSLYMGLQRGRYVLHNAMLLAAITFTHVYTLLWVVSSSVFLLLGREKKQVIGRATYLAKTYFLSFLLTGFWVVPMVLRLAYTTPYDIVWNISEDVLPPILWPFALIFVVGLFAGIFNRDERVMLLAFSILPCMFFFRFASWLGVVDIRFVPFVYLALMLIGAYGMNQIARSLKAKGLLVILVLILTMFWVESSKVVFTGTTVTGNDLSAGRLMNLMNPLVFHPENITTQLLSWRYSGYSDFWVQWNYEGFENKQLWSQFRSTNDFLRAGPADARAQFEHSELYDPAGSVRAFESIPLFSGRSIIEGLYMSSIETAPFAFYIQSEISEQKSCPYWATYPCTYFRLDDGTEHLKMFNVQYIVARSERLKAAMRGNPQWELAYSDDPFEVWNLTTNPGRYVTVPLYEPVLFQTVDWKNISYHWFRRMDLIPTPIVFRGSVDSTDLSTFRQIVRNPTFGDLDGLTSLPAPAGCNVTEVVSAEAIEFTTDCIGAPHIVAVSYYPSWTAEGADRVYLVSPSFMLVYPRQNTVRLSYSKLPEDWLGIGMSALGAIVIIYTVFGADQRAKRFFGLIN